MFLLIEHLNFAFRHFADIVPEQSVKMGNFIGVNRHGIQKRNHLILEIKIYFGFFLPFQDKSGKFKIIKAGDHRSYMPMCKGWNFPDYLEAAIHRQIFDIKEQWRNSHQRAIAIFCFFKPACQIRLQPAYNIWIASRVVIPISNTFPLAVQKFFSLHAMKFLAITCKSYPPINGVCWRYYWNDFTVIYGQSNRSNIFK